MRTPETPSRDGEKGMMLIFMALALVGLIGAGSLALDIGMGLVTKTELQNVADASALSGTRELAEIYKKDPYKIGTDLPESDQKAVRDTAKEYALANKAGSKSIAVPNEDLLLGEYDKASGEVTPTNHKVRAVQTTSRREEGVNGVLPTQLATVLGINSMSVRATSAAALTPIGKLKGGAGDFPIGISRQWFDSHSCTDPTTIVIFPTSSDSCASWHTFDTHPASANRLGVLVDGLRRGTYSSPETIAGETYYNFIGGTVESRCSNLLKLWEAKQVEGVMRAHIPVYDMDCGNANQERLILGFIDADISNVVCGASERRLDLTVKCEIICDEAVATGGGPNDFGLLACSSGMVN